MGEPHSTSWLALRFRLIISFFVLGVQSIEVGVGKAKEMMVGDDGECIACGNYRGTLAITFAQMTGPKISMALTAIRTAV